jgi:hypothetical protein
VEIDGILLGWVEAARKSLAKRGEDAFKESLVGA